MSQAPEIPGTDVTHREVREVLPWYVAGTLDPAEAARVAAHVARCPACAADARAERRLAEAVAHLVVEDIGAARGWQALRQRLSAEGAILPAPPTGAAARVRPLRSVPRRYVPLAAVAAAAAAVGLAGMAILWHTADRGTSPGAGSFRTLTEPRPAASGQGLRVQVAPGTAHECVAALARAEGLAVGDGPSPRGVYTLVIADGDAPLSERAERLRIAPEILFVGSRPDAAPGRAALAAPGIDILSTAPGGAYDYFTGSSISAAHVSGIVALLREARPGVAGPVLAETLRRASSATGSVNACEAVRMADPKAAGLVCSAASPQR